MALELLQIFCLMYVFRGRANITTLEQQFQQSPPFGYKSWPMTKRRYNIIINSLSCNWTLLQELLRCPLRSILNKPPEEVVHDESLMQYFSQGEQSCTSPQRFIPRKPHPNGLFQLVFVLNLLRFTGIFGSM